MIIYNCSINGITINNQQYKISQFADDTTLFLDGTKDSLEAALNTLEIFGSVSGLVVNKDKTKLIWLGKKNVQLTCMTPMRICVGEYLNLICWGFVSLLTQRTLLL